jgi:response regulator of citrate/malate metabolism
MPDTKKILIIDDEIDLCLLLKEYFFRKKNFEVIVAHTLSEGKSLIDTIRPDILFLDNNLPDGVGWGNAPYFAQKFPGIYIILISAFHPALPDMPLGAKFRIIEKPITFSDLDKQFLNPGLGVID